MPQKTINFHLIRLANLIFDRILANIRWIFLPFRILTSLTSWVLQLIWILSNEYTKLQLGDCGRGVRIYGRLRLTGAEHIHLGNNVHINDNAFLRGEGGLFIGDNTHISRNLVIYTINHRYQGKRLPYDEQQVSKPVKIGANVWIGMNVMIVPGITIGDGAIIGMGTVVSKDVPTLAIIGSSVPRILKKRDAAHYSDLTELNAYSGMSGYEWK